MLKLEGEWGEKFVFPGSLKDETFISYFRDLNDESQSNVIEFLADTEWE